MKKFDLRDSDIAWLSKINDRLWRKIWSGSGDKDYYPPNGTLSTNEWQGILALVCIYDLPIIMIEGKSIWDLKIKIHNHETYMGVKPNTLLRLSPYHFRDFVTGYKINGEVEMFIKYTFPLTDTKRNKELLGFYGLETMNKDRQSELRFFCL